MATSVSKDMRNLHGQLLVKKRARGRAAPPEDRNSNRAFERKSEYRIRWVACLFYERVEPHDWWWLNATKLFVVCGYWLI